MHYVLHGHQHLPFVGKTTRFDWDIANTGNDSFNTRELYVLASGSSGAKLEVIPPQVSRNTFSLYTVTENTLEVQIEQYTDRIPPTEYVRFKLPLLKRSDSRHGRSDR